MGGGLMQLVAYGAQDIYLTGNPQITFFKVVYRRHTNFAMESIEQTFNGTPAFGNKVTVSVSRNGDLINRAYLQSALPTVTPTVSGAWTRFPGHALILNVEVEIGGQRIDKHYGQWLTIWNELTQTAEHEDGYNIMVGNTVDLTTDTVAAIAAATLYIPMQFWFNRNPGLALPLIALQYHEVKLNFEFRAFAEMHSGTITTPTLGTTSLWVDYIYLDTDERRRFAQQSHEYLIEQLQHTGAESVSTTNINLKLNFNHPVKELVWVIQLDSNVTLANGSRQSDFTDNGSGVNPYAGADTLSTAKLQLNGHDRFKERTAAYFNLVQPYQHHTRVPAVGIYVYSFAVRPEEHQPSGSCNMSRIDNATLVLVITANAAVGSKIYTYAVNYNVLRIMSGMGGLAYSN